MCVKMLDHDLLNNVVLESSVKAFSAKPHVGVPQVPGVLFQSI